MGTVPPEGLSGHIFEWFERSFIYSWLYDVGVEINVGKFFTVYRSRTPGNDRIFHALLVSLTGHDDH